MCANDFESFLLCRPLSATKTGQVLKIYFFSRGDLICNQCFSLCTEGALAMSGVRQGFRAKVKKVNPKGNFLLPSPQGES